MKMVYETSLRRPILPLDNNLYINGIGGLITDEQSFATLFQCTVNDFDRLSNDGENISLLVKKPLHISANTFRGSFNQTLSGRLISFISFTNLISFGSAAFDTYSDLKDNLDFLYVSTLKGNLSRLFADRGNFRYIVTKEIESAGLGTSNESALFFDNTNSGNSSDHVWITGDMNTPQFDYNVNYFNSRVDGVVRMILNYNAPSKPVLEYLNLTNASVTIRCNNTCENNHLGYMVFINHIFYDFIEEPIYSYFTVSIYPNIINRIKIIAVDEYFNLSIISNELRLDPN